MRYVALTLLMLCGIGWAAADAQAQNAGAIRLLGNAVVNADSSPTVQVTPVRVGWGWRGPGWYPGGYRPYATYYRPYGGYYGYPGPVRTYNYYRGAYYPPYWRY